MWLNKTPENPLPFYAELHRRFPALVRMSLPFGLNFVISFRPEHVAGIVRAADKTPGPLQLMPWLRREKIVKSRIRRMRRI